MPMPENQFKFRADLKQPEMSGNRIRGMAAMMGNMDYGNDVIFPGAFKAALPAFLKNGFVAEGHDWYELPIAMPVSAMEEGNALVTEAEFHTTQDGQDARTVCMERLARGLSVGLSVGFKTDPNGCHYFENGENLLTFAKDNGYDTKLFDSKGIMACDMYCRGITQISDLFEYSIVSMPMNPLAVATEAKGASGSTSLPIAERDHAWDASAAEGRVREWAGAQDAPNSKYASAFFFKDAENTDQFGAYHLPFADVVDGKLTAIPRGVFAAAGAIQGARGADGEKYADAKPKIARYYARMRKQFNDDGIVAPWDDSGKMRVFDISAVSTLRDVERTLRDAGFSKSDAPEFISTIKGILLRRDAGSEDEPKADEQVIEPEPPAIIIPDQKERRIRFTLGGKVCPPYVNSPSL